MIDYRYLRPLKGQALKQWHDCFYKHDDLQCLVYENAVVLPVKPDGELLFGKGGVIADGKYIEQSGIIGRVGGYYSFTDPIGSDLSVVYCGYLPNHWGHFLIEGVARLWYLFEASDDIDKYVFIVDEYSSAELKGNYREFFELLGIIGKIELVDRPVEYKRVYVPELGYKPESWYSDKYLKIFECVADRAISKSGETDAQKKVFLSRAHFAKAGRTEMGLDMLDSFFRNNGYAIVYPETVSLTALINCLNSAELVAAESGTLPHNLLFARSGKKCQIMERQTTPNEFQANIDIMKQLDVTYVDCHYMIYPVSAGGGPYLLAYNRWMQTFADDNSLVPPDKKFLKDRYTSNCVRKYLKAYVRDYAYTWGLEPWMLKYSDAYYEAYADSCEDLVEYLNGMRPILIEDILNKRVMKYRITRKREKLNNGIRMFAKNILGGQKYENLKRIIKGQ